jgi:multiple antibiotic resistance protein
MEDCKRLTLSDRNFRPLWPIYPRLFEDFFTGPARCWLVALDLLIGNERKPSNESDVNVALVPLGTPLLAGPGAIVATIIFVKQANSSSTGSFSMMVALFIAIILLHVLLGVVLAYSTGIIKLIKKSGVTLIARIAGLLLAAIAVQMIADSVRAFISA